MERDGGIFKVKCKVNGAPMKMYFDTGATTVSISRATAIYLYDNDLINKEDFLGKVNSTTAEGTIADNMLIRLKDIEIGGLHLNNVEAVVSSSLNAPLLFGQSAISKLGKITLNGDILTVHSLTSSRLSKEERNALESKLIKLTSDTTLSSNYEIIDILNKIEKGDELSEKELFKKMVAETNVNYHDDALLDSERWIDKYAMEIDSTDLKMKAFFISARSNILSKYGKKELGMQRLNKCINYFTSNSSEDSNYIWWNLPEIYFKYEEYMDNGFSNSIQVTKMSANHFLKKEKFTIKDINYNKCINNKTLQLILGVLAYTYFKNCEWNNSKNVSWSNNELTTYIIYSILAAKVGNIDYIGYCRSNGLDFKRVLTKEELEFVMDTTTSLF